MSTAMPDVWAGDAVAQSSIAQQSIVHPLCQPVDVKLGDVGDNRRVGLAMPDGRVLAHRPLPQLPGSVSTFPAAISALDRPHIIEGCKALLEESGLAARCLPIALRQAKEDELLLVHTPEYIHRIMSCRYLPHPSPKLHVAHAGARTLWRYCGWHPPLTPST